MSVFLLHIKEKHSFENITHFPAAMKRSLKWNVRIGTLRCGERWLLICLTFIPQAWAAHPLGSLASRRYCARDAQRLEQAPFQPHRPQAALFPPTWNPSSRKLWNLLLYVILFLYFFFCSLRCRLDHLVGKPFVWWATMGSKMQQRRKRRSRWMISTGGKKWSVEMWKSLKRTKCVFKACECSTLYWN